MVLLFSTRSAGLQRFGDGHLGVRHAGHHVVHLRHADPHGFRIPVLGECPAHPKPNATHRLGWVVLADVRARGDADAVGVSLRDVRAGLQRRVRRLRRPVQPVLGHAGQPGQARLLGHAAHHLRPGPGSQVSSRRV